MTMNGLNGHFTLNFHYYEPRFQQLGYTLTVESVCTRDQRRWADMRKRTVIRRIFESAVKLRIFRRCYIVGTLTNKANISIQYYIVPDRLSTDSLTPKPVTLNNLE